MAGESGWCILQPRLMEDWKLDSKRSSRLFLMGMVETESGGASPYQNGDRGARHTRQDRRDYESCGRERIGLDNGRRRRGLFAPESGVTMIRWAGSGSANVPSDGDLAAGSFR